MANQNEHDRQGGKLLSRRQLLKGIGAAAALPILAACGAAPAATPSTSATTAPATTNEGGASDAPEPTTPPAASGEQVTLIMWKGPHRPAGEETEQVARPVLDKFEEANSGIKVDFTEVPWGQYNEKFTAAFAAGNPPDVSYQTESFPRFVDAGHIMPLDDLIKSANFDREFIYPQMWDLATYGGKSYAMPWIAGASAFFWNKDLFEQAGLDPDKAPDTAEEMLSFAQKITKDDVYGFGASPKDFHEPGQWPRRFGGDWFNEDNTQCTIDSPEALEGFRYFADLYHTHRVALPGEIAGQEPGLQGYFRDGKVAMQTAQTPIVNTLRKEKPDFKLGASIVPKGTAPEPKGRSTYGGVGYLAIAQVTKHVEESWKLLQYMVTPDALMGYIGTLGFMSVSPKVNYYADDPILSVCQENVQFSFPWPYTSWVFAFWDIVTTNMEALTLGQKSPEDAAKEIADKTNSLLESEATKS